MNRPLRILLLLVVTLIGGHTLQAQSTRLRAANKQFESFSYITAVRMYEDFLRTDKQKNPTESREALTNLAFSYRKLQDTRNAERVYAELVNKYTDLSSEIYMYYAQALAANGKYRESQKMYSKYGEQQTQDLRGRRFTVSYMDVGRFYQDSSSYKIYSLPINSRQADFSPMFYKGGIVFVSARDESGPLKRVFTWNQTPFLDLYFHADTNEIHAPMVDMLRQPNTAVLGGSKPSAAAAPDLASTAPVEQKLSKTQVFSRTLNTKYHEGPMTFTRDQKTIVFTRNNGSKGKTGKSNEGVRKLKLYTAINEKGNKWINVRELPFNNKEYSVGHPAFAPDNSKMYFVSDMPGGFGGTDLYVVEYRNGEWGTPVNMGKDINTEGNEMFPYADENGNLYFSSDGHEGLGGLDVFYAELKDGVAYKGVENVGAPVNSEKDDFGMITDKYRTTGYFSSNRKKGVSDDDIYSFRRTCKELNILVYDAKTNAPLEQADVRIVRNGSNQDLLLTDPQGSAKLCLDANTEYEFKAVKEGYTLNTVRFSTLTQSPKPVMGVTIYLEKSENTIVRGVVKREVDQIPEAGVKVTLKNEKDKSEQTVETGPDGGYEFAVKPGTPFTLKAAKNKYATKKTPIRKTKKGVNMVISDSLGLYGEGDIYQLRNIYYDLDKFFIRPDAARELEHVVTILKEYPTMKVELRSHTDSRASDAYNLRLSENRARAAMDYIVSRGIKADRMVSRGYGESEILNGCIDGTVCDNEQHQRNRRTEFKIISVQ